METCSCEKSCKQFNGERFNTCYNPSWYLDNERRCSTRTELVRKQIPQVVQSSVNTLGEVVQEKKAKKLFLQELFKTGCTLADGIQKLLISFPGTDFYKAENYVWNYFYEKRRQGKVEGDKTGVVCIK